MNSYLDISIGEYFFDNVVAELARCMSLFPNLHTVQIDIAPGSKRLLDKIFQRTFKKYSYPQIRNVFVMSLSLDLLPSCPEAKRVGFIQRSTVGRHWDLSKIAGSCPQLETLDDFGYNFWGPNSFQRRTLPTSELNFANHLFF